MGLVWLWIAAAWFVLVPVARSAEIDGRKRLGFGVVLGLAPLVRPDLGLMMLCVLVAWFMLVRPRRIVFDVVAIFALPLAYQIFRMGYYAMLVPTTALAKDAGGLHFGQGWDYARNFIGPYRLWLTAILIAATVAYRSLANRDRRLAIATAAMLAAALVHALYITAIGGDYMHGRLLLPAFFALALPASISVPTIAVTRRTLAVIGINAFAAVWAIVSVVAFRPPPNPKSYLLSPITDFRAASHAMLHPTDIQFGLNGYEAAAAYDRGVRGYFKVADKHPLPALDPRVRVDPRLDRCARVRRGPAHLGRRHRRARGTARGAHCARSRARRRPSQADRRSVVQRAFRRDCGNEQPEGRRRPARAGLRPDPRVARRGGREDDSGPLLLEHLAQRRQHDVAHPDRPGGRRAEVVQGLTRQRGDDRLGHHGYRLRGVDRDEDAARFVELEDRAGVGVEELQPALDHPAVGVIDPAGARPARKPAARDVVGQREVHSRLGLDSLWPGKLIGALRLRPRAREPVEDVSTTGLARGGDRFAHDSEDDVVGNEITPRESGGDLYAELALGRDVRAQQLAARHVAHAQTFGQKVTLGAFTGSRRAEQDESQGVMIARSAMRAPTRRSHRSGSDRTRLARLLEPTHHDTNAERLQLVQ